MSDRGGLDAAIQQVVDSGNCSGCGACALLDPGIEMELNGQGYLRPVRRQQPELITDVGDVRRQFAASCPGISVKAQRPPGSRRHAQLGPIIGMWEAWAVDPDIRHAGSSGGTLTALSAWLLQTGISTRVVGASADPTNPRRTIPVQITSREEALRSSGSRYAPVGNAAAAGRLDPHTAFVGKPCEVSAIRALVSDGEEPNAGPILLSFFCAGTPSQLATEELAEVLGVAHDEPVTGLRYRGRGWPGEFALERADGSTATASYDDSWGKYLGPTTQWRCKICPDGVGESADITAGDFWRSDENGYPLFADQAGISALIARTERGRRLVMDAAEAGIISLKSMEPEPLVDVQPLQRKRRETLLARLAGTVAAGGRIPRFSGFSLLRLALPHPREAIRTAKGTFRRRRSLRRDGRG